MTESNTVQSIQDQDSLETRSAINLRRKPRIGEWLIQIFLFLSAAISIVTTVGIIYELGVESLGFFSRTLWENTNKSLTTAIDLDTTELAVSASGRSPLNGDQIKIEEEIMLVTTVSSNVINVERGYKDTVPAQHRAELTLFRANKVTLIEFFTGTTWIPQIGKFGILPLVNSTIIVSLIAMVIAVPVGLSIAIYLSEYATTRVRSVLKPILEILAGIPTVVYGYFALTFMTPSLRTIFGASNVEIYNMAAGGIVIGILVVPLISSISEDALSSVPRSLREGSYALGATKLEVAIRIVVPAAISGIAAAIILAISRAIGETMIAALAIGAGPNFTFNPFKGAETMTGHIVRISGGDLSYDSIDYNSLFAIGLLLFFITLGLNIISQQIVRRFREVYE